jgi:tetratricopeptide (TPR) repeat protein
LLRHSAFANRKETPAMKSLLRIGFGIALLAPLAMTVPKAVSAHEVDAPSPSAGLGALSFTTSARSHEAQASFVRGALLLHLFEYDDAAKAFAAAQAEEPDFVMAVWGEAMTYNHPLWNQLDEAAGRKALEKLGKTSEARAKKAHTAREKAYLAAVEILYSGDGTKVERDQRYLDAMQALASTWPDDNQAQLFHALALEGRSEGVRNVPDYLRAAEISRRIFEKNPQNPGAAHYWIHGMDDPEHANGAIEAARALSKIAPDAGHAQHMTSHIFIAMGLWDDLVQANEEAVRVVDAHARSEGKPEISCFHYNEWLEYGYFQQGRHRDAMKLLLDCKRSGESGIPTITDAMEAKKVSERFGRSLPTMRATAVIESRDWNGPAPKLSMPASGDGYALALNRFSIGYAAAQRGDTRQADISFAELDDQVAVAKRDGDDPQLFDYMHILRDDLAGLIEAKRGNTEKALTLVRGAATRMDGLAFDFGPPVPVKPPHELLGELLLAADKPAEAAEAFSRSLKLAPLRAQSLLGLARAQAAAGESANATMSYSKLLDIWHAADSDQDGLDEARSYMAAHPGG